MPTLPSVDHYRDNSLTSTVPDPDPQLELSTPPATISPNITPATDPPTLHTTFTGSVVGSISRRNRRSFAALAQKTSSAFANLSISQTTPLRSTPSTSSLSRLSRSFSATPLTPPLSDGESNETLEFARAETPTLADPTPNQRRRLTIQRLPTPPYNRLLPPGSAQTAHPKMHQTSSRLLRMTEDERPFTKVGFHHIVTSDLKRPESC